MVIHLSESVDMTKKIMTITMHSKSIFKPDPEIKFQVKDLKEAQDILNVMIENDVPVKRCSVIELYEGEE